jgi:hypothetical protein
MEMTRAMRDGAYSIETEDGDGEHQAMQNETERPIAEGQYMSWATYITYRNGLAT